MLRIDNRNNKLFVFVNMTSTNVRILCGAQVYCYVLTASTNNSIASHKLNVILTSAMYIFVVHCMSGGRKCAVAGVPWRGSASDTTNTINTKDGKVFAPPPNGFASVKGGRSNNSKNSSHNRNHNRSIIAVIIITIITITIIRKTISALAGSGRLREGALVEVRQLPRVAATSLV